MSDIDTTLPNTAQNFDAEELKGAIDQGELQVPELNVEDDYEAAQKYSESGLTSEEAESVVAPQFEVSAASEVTITPETSLSESSGDSAAYLDMAKQVSRVPSGTTAVTDELVAKALEKGEAGA